MRSSIMKRFLTGLLLLLLATGAQAQITGAKPACGSLSLDTGETHFPEHLYTICEGTGTLLNDDGSSVTDWDLTFAGGTGAGPDWDTDATHGTVLDFVDTNEDEATNTVSVSGMSGTMTMCVFSERQADHTAAGAGVALADSSQSDRYIKVLSGSNELAWTRARFDNGLQQDQGGSLTQDVWMMYCGRFSDSTMDRSFNGSAWDTNVVSHTGLIASLDSVSVGVSPQLFGSDWFDDNLAAVAIWEGSKSDAEISTIWNGGNPWPIIGMDLTTGPTFLVSPSVTATTITSYTLSYTPSQSTTFYTVACNPGESEPTVAQIKTADCGSGADAEASANEAVTGADTTQITGISMLRHDIYSVLSDVGGDSVVDTLPNEDRTTDPGQTKVVTVSISATSIFALATDSTGDTTINSPTITGMTDTSDFQVGMFADVSSGFPAGAHRIESLTSTSVTLSDDATSTVANVTTTSDVYFVPTAAAADVIEGDTVATCAAGTDALTWQTDGDFSYTATTCGSTLTTIDYCIQDVSDATGEYTTPACWSVDDTVYLFNTPPVCDDEGPGNLVLEFNVPMTAVDFSLLCSDPDAQAIAYSIFSGTPPTGTTLDVDGVLTGTPTVEDETGVTLRIKALDTGGLGDILDDRFIWVVDTVTAPTLTDSDEAAAVTDMQTSFPWRTTDLGLTITDACSTVEAAGQVLSQSPTAGSEVVASQQFDIVVSLGSVCGTRRRLED